MLGLIPSLHNSCSSRSLTEIDIPKPRFTTCLTMRRPSLQEPLGAVERAVLSVELKDQAKYAIADGENETE